MMSPTAPAWFWIAWALRTLMCVVVGYAAFAAWRVLARRSPLDGSIVGTGLVMRGVLGSLLFYVSFANLQLLSTLHSGNGFWQLAPDARGYYNAAQAGLRDGIATIGYAVPSWAFVRVLALWMGLVGSSPSAAILLNLLFYLGLCWLLVRETDRGLARRLPLVAVTCSPALLIFGTQSLKDVFFSLLIAVVCVGVRAMTAWLEVPRLAAVPRATWLAAGAVPVSVYLMAGVRPYFPAFVVVALGAALLLACVRSGRPRLRRCLTRAIVILIVVAAAWGAAIGPYFQTYTASAASEASGLFGLWDRGRDAFIRSGGATNVGTTADDGMSGGHRVAATATGTLLLSVPVTLLRKAGLVSFPGGRGLTLLADLDTVFVDVTALAALALVLSRRRRGGVSSPYAAFIGMLAVLVGLSLAYVVTNFGTLLRLRLMLAVPLWMLPLALTNPVAASGAPAAAADTCVTRAPASRR